MVKTLGVSGSIASGKSYFVKVFIDLLKEQNVEYYHFDADKETHEVIRKNHKEISALLNIIDLYKDGVSDSERAFSKAILNKILSSSELNKTYQTYIWNILYGELLRSRDNFFSSIKDKGLDKGVFIFDAAFLFGAGWDNLADMIVKVVADTDVRKARFVERSEQNVHKNDDKNHDKSHFEAQFDLIEKASEKERYLDRERNRKIIFIMNNTNTTGDVPLELEAKTVYTCLFEEKPW